jgi:hypothetical protein
MSHPVNMAMPACRAKFATTRLSRMPQSLNQANGESSATCGASTSNESFRGNRFFVRGVLALALFSVTNVFLVYYLDKAHEDNFLAVLCAGITVLALECYRIWNNCAGGMAKNSEEQEHATKTGRSFSLER